MIHLSVDDLPALRLTVVSKTERDNAVTLIEALNDPHLRDSIEAIDDLWASLDYGSRREPTLEELLASEVFILRARGVEYDPRT